MTHVTKQTAVLLKEKGINVPTDYVYAYSEGDMTISAPTLYEAADWLRETKGVHVYVTCTYGEWDFSIENAVNGESLHDTYYTFQTHDLALEAGIIHALKHYVK